MPLQLRFFAIVLQSKVHNAVQYFCIGPHFVPKRDIKKVSFKDCFSYENLWNIIVVKKIVVQKKDASREVVGLLKKKLS